MKRHVKRCHPGLRQNKDPIQLPVGKKAEDKTECSASNAEQKDKYWLTQSPRNLICDLYASPSSSRDSGSGESDTEQAIPPKAIREDSLLEGHLIREKTMLSVPFSRKKKSNPESSVPEKRMLINRSIQVSSPNRHVLL